jgi:hypothetical protein
MSRVAYVDGQNLPFCSAAVHIDPGYQFADGVYEVPGVVVGQLSRTLRTGHLAQAAA